MRLIFATFDARVVLMHDGDSLPPLTVKAAANDDDHEDDDVVFNIASLVDININFVIDYVLIDVRLVDIDVVGKMLCEDVKVTVFDD